MTGWSPLIMRSRTPGIPLGSEEHTSFSSPAIWFSSPRFSVYYVTNLSPEPTRHWSMLLDQIEPSFTPSTCGVLFLLVGCKNRISKIWSLLIFSLIGMNVAVILIAECTLVLVFGSQFTFTNQWASCIDCSSLGFMGQATWHRNPSYRGICHRRCGWRHGILFLQFLIYM